LHVYIEDVVPTIAFANKANMPPIIFVVQADHQFWIGVSISDLFVHLRESGMWLSEKRRRIKREKMGYLPIPLDPISSKTSQSEAKKRIGFSKDTIILLSIARAVKYEPIREPRFVEAAVPILNKYRNAVLLVVGPANVDQWRIGHERAQGRILALGQRSDTHDFYEAADVYLDSFPFSSNTSLLEAASHGLPLVSYFPYSKEAEVLGAGAPGLESTLLRVRSLEDWEKTISRLIEDKEFRAQIGEKTKQEIVSMHSGGGWNRCLEELYHKIAVTPLTAAWDGLDQNCAGELDLLLNRFYSRHVPLGWVIGWYARDLPYSIRLQLLVKMLKVNRSFSFSMFLPNWLGKRLGERMRGWRHLPGIGRWLSAKR
jgi:glycosyltransferase involved in cell wall biosynthesis